MFVARTFQSQSNNNNVKANRPRIKTYLADDGAKKKVAPFNAPHKCNKNEQQLVIGAYVYRCINSMLAT